MNYIYILLTLFLTVLDVLVHKDIVYNKFECKEYDFGFVSLVSWTLVLFENIIIACFLGILGLYSLKSMSGIILCLILFLYFFVVKKFDFVIIGKTINFQISKELFIILFLLVIINLSFPTYYLFGGRDHGLYFVNAVHMVKTGGIKYGVDNVLKELPLFLKDCISGYPGIYITSKLQKLGVIVPDDYFQFQFLPMISSYYAVLYSLGGLELLIRGNGILALFAIVWGYYLCKITVSKKAGVLFAVVFGVCPALIWNARIPESEILAALFFLVSSVFFYIGWRKEKNNIWIIIGSIIVSIGGFNRIDHYLVTASIYIISIYCICFSDEKRIIHNSILSSVIVFAGMIISVLYTYKFNSGYFNDLGHAKSVRMLLLGNGILIIANLCCFVVRKQYFKHSLPNLLRIICRNSVLRLACCLALCAFILLSLDFSVWNDSDFSGGGLRALSFYIGVIVPFAAVLGFYYLMETNKDEADYSNNVEPLLYFIVTGFICFLLYIIKPSITPDHPWASRRWISQTIPFLLYLFVYAVYYVEKEKESAIKRVFEFFVIETVVFMLYQNRLFLTTSMLNQLPERFDILAEAIPDDGVVLTDTRVAASLLKYVYDKNVFYVDELEDYMKSGYFLQESSPKIYFLTDKMFGRGFSKLGDEIILGGTYVLPSFGEYISKLQSWEYALQIYEVKK